MKKLIIIFVLGLMVTVFTSCKSKKDYTCECVVAGQTMSFEIKDVTKKGAQDACPANGVTGSCKLK